MPIIRVEEVSYGVDDVEKSRRFLNDWGLEELQAGDGGAQFATLTHQIIWVRPIDHPALPAPIAAGNNIRQVIFGVEKREDLDGIAAELGRDRPITRGEAGEVFTTDLNGYPIGFRVAAPKEFSFDRRLANNYGHNDRVNQVLGRYERAHPIRIIHVALDIPKEGRREATDFYINRLGFKPVEDIAPTGTFLQCEGEVDHHQLFLCHRTNAMGINHIAFEVRDFDEIAEGGNYLGQRGWEEARRLGRHTVGSNVFRFFHAPMGGRVEYASDMDKVEKATPPKFWPESPPHHLWILKGGEGGHGA